MADADPITGAEPPEVDDVPEDLGDESEITDDLIARAVALWEREAPVEYRGLLESGED